MVRRLTLEKMQSLAEMRGGKCLSTEYLGNKNKLLWQCAAGHQWEAAPNSIKNAGTWCQHCAGCSPLTLEEMQELAETRGGKCLSTEYLGNKIKLLWQCAAGHQWEAAPNNVKHAGTWCPHCAGKAPLTIEGMQELAETRGGKCLSTEYCNANSTLLWQCEAGHQWEAVSKNVKNADSWCPHCCMHIGEELVRMSLEEAFHGLPFERTRRVPWLRPLELDGYNEALGLAFEYQGRQHYKHIDFFHRTADAFEKQKARDKRKQERCNEHDVILLVISYDVRHKDLRAHVRKELEGFYQDDELVSPSGTDEEFYDRVRCRMTLRMADGEL
jgi:hypothetical protein